MGAVPPERLREVVRAALGEPEASAGAWEAVPLRGGAGAGGLGGEGALYALSGTARVGAAERPWRVVLKVLTPQPARDDPTHVRYWRREPLLYRSGLLDGLDALDGLVDARPGGLRAPAC